MTRASANAALSFEGGEAPGEGGEGANFKANPQHSTIEPS